MEINCGPWRPVPVVCRMLCINVPGLAGNLSDLAVPSSQHDILLCYETLVSYMRHVLELLIPGFGSPFLCPGKTPWARGMAAYVRDGYGAFTHPNLIVVVQKCILLGFVVGGRTFMCLVFIATMFVDYQIFYYLLHLEWLVSTTTNRHGVAAIEFATVSGCDQLVVGITHARCGTLAIRMTMFLT